MSQRHIKKPLVSIITVCLNSEEYIEDTIKSVLNQTYPNIEYIIIDGGSTDGTLDIIKEYEPKFEGRMKWISGPDEGIYDAMNKGIKKAQGEVIGILNSDDWYNEDAVEKVVNCFLENERLSLVHGKMARHDSNGELDSVYGRRKMWGISGRITPYNHPTCFVKKEIYKKIGLFDTQYKMAADSDFMLKIYRNEKMKTKYIPEILTNFRLTGVSSTTPPVFKEVYKILKKNDCNFLYIARALFFKAYSFCLKRILVKARLTSIINWHRKKSFHHSSQFKSVKNEIGEPRMKTRFSAQLLIALTIFLIILRPNPGLFDSRLELLGGSFLFLLPILFFLFWLINDYQTESKNKLPALPKHTKVFFLGISVWIILVGLISFLIGTSEFSLVNLAEFARYPVYFLIFIAGYYASLFVDSQRFTKWLSLATFISCGVALIQFSSFPILDSMVRSIYGVFKLRPITQTVRNFRVYGTFRNANWWGAYLIIVLPFIWHRYRKKELLKLLLVILTLFLGIFISGSRSAWIGVLLLLLFFSLCTILLKLPTGERVFRKYWIPLMLVGILFISSLALMPSTYSRLQELTSFFSSRGENLFDSASKRLQNWKHYLSKALERPIVGYGPSQSKSKGLIENSYILLFYKYGLPSLIFLSVFYLGLIYEGLHSRRIIGLALIASMLIIIYSSIFKRLWDTLQVVSIALFIHGFYIGVIKNKSNEK